MIQYSLQCENGHGFEAWFRNAAAYDEQAEQGIVTCPVCASQKIDKALMAPAIARNSRAARRVPATSDNRGKMAVSIGHPQQAELRAAMKALRDKVVAEADYVGDRFAEEARRLHEDEPSERRGIYGEATAEEVTGLREDGIDVVPLPVLPEDHN